MFDAPQTWEQHRTFYEAAIAVVTDQLDAGWLQALRQQIQVLTDQPLSERVRVTLQEMVQGQFAEVHSDRPLLGFETLRLVVQLTPDWAPGDGGEYQIHAAQDGPCLASLEPLHGSAVLFALHPGSLHAVAPTRIRRRTAVFHFHHRGSSTALATAVHELFVGMAFGELPPGLDPLISHAEAHASEDDSFRACAVAWALTRWGCEPDTLHAGFTAGLSETLAGHEPTAVLLAHWAARLAFSHVDLDRWAVLEAVLAARPSLSGPAESWRALAFPTP